jgi:hypothetical protein
VQGEKRGGAGGGRAYASKYSCATGVVYGMTDFIEWVSLPYFLKYGVVPGNLDA